MSNPETPYSEEITVIAHPLADEVYFYGPDGRMAAPSKQVKPLGDTDKKISLLTELYATLGPGSHEISDIQELLSLNRLNTQKLLNRIASVAIPGVCEYTVNQRVVFGCFSVAERIPTEEEKIIFADRSSAAAKLERARQREDAQEAQKFNLDPYDHVIIDGGRPGAFELPLETMDAIVLVRVLEALQGMGPGKYVAEGDVIAQAWRNMPLVERSLFIKEDEEVYLATKAALRKYTQDILPRLTGKLGFTRIAGAQSMIAILASPELDFKENPAERGAHGVPLLFAPGQEQSSDVCDTANQADKETARELIDAFITHRTPLNQQRALEVLDYIMTREAKTALSEVLAEQGSSLSLSEALLSLHQLVKSRLGKGYLGARRARAVRGTRSGTFITQIGGRLPGTTKKWQIGRTYQNPNNSLDK